MKIKDKIVHLIFIIFYPNYIKKKYYIKINLYYIKFPTDQK